MKLAIAIATSMILLTAADAAQGQSRYGSWKEQANGGQTKLLKELEDLIGEAEKARAADPRFLRDLRALVRRHSNAWPEQIVYDDFTDGDFTQNPTWTVASGYFRVNRSGGLESSSYQQREQSRETSDSNRDVAVRLLEQLLNPNKGGQQQQQQRQGGPGEIFLAKQVPNAFSLSAELSGGGDAGFELGVYQGQKRTVGYRLIYTPKDGMVLLRIGARGSSVVDRAAPKANLLDGKDRTLVWQRDGDGLMSVSIDGAKLFDTTDRGFRDPFDGFHMFNRGGDLTLFTLAIDGAR